MEKTQKNNSYYLHIFENENIPNFTFVRLDQFLSEDKYKKKEYEIFLGDCLEYFDQKSAVERLKKLISKLEKDSVIYIQGVDIKSVSYNFASDQMGEAVFNSIVHGLGKKTSFSFAKIKYILENIGNIEIQEIKFINSISYYIECKVL